MRFLLFGIFLLVILLTNSFVHNREFKALKNGCSGSGCHQYLPGFMQLEMRQNLKIFVKPESQLRGRPISAELIDVQGKLVDYQKASSNSPVILNAPKPGKYKVVAGYKLKSLYWDSLLISVEPSIVSLPSSRYSAVSFKLFPVHPNPVKDAAVIRFLQPRDADSEITLFSAAGLKISTIYEGFLNKGMHAIYWEARDQHKRRLPPGNYLCELRSGSQKLVEKIYINQ